MFVSFLNIIKVNNIIGRLRCESVELVVNPYQQWTTTIRLFTENNKLHEGKRVIQLE